MTPEKARREALAYAAALPGARMLRELIDVAHQLGAEGLLSGGAGECWTITEPGRTYLAVGFHQASRTPGRAKRRAVAASEQMGLCWFCRVPMVKPRKVGERGADHPRSMSLTTDGDGIERAACRKCCMEPGRAARYEIARNGVDSR